MENIRSFKWLQSAITDIGTRVVLIEQALARIEARPSCQERKPEEDVRYVASKEQLAKLLAKVLGDDDGREPKS